MCLCAKIKGTERSGIGAQDLWQIIYVIYPTALPTSRSMRYTNVT